MHYSGIANADRCKITQTWKRTRVEDDVAQAQVLASVANYSSKEAIAKANPIVDDWQQEIKDQQADIQTSDGFAADQSFNVDDYTDKSDSEQQEKEANSK